MCKKHISTAVITTSLILLASQSSVGRDRLAYDSLLQAQTLSATVDDDCSLQHTVGNIVVNIGNWQGFGGIEWVSPMDIDCATGNDVIPHTAEYPKGSELEYLMQTDFWIGAVYDGDTLVTRGVRSTQPPEIRSNLDPTDPSYEGALSQQDYLLVGTDIYPRYINLFELPDLTDGLLTPHSPLNVEVTQRSHSWSYDYAEDFVLFDVRVKNIGDRTIEDTYFALTQQPMVQYRGMNGWRFDDLVGFLRSFPVASGCGLVDKLDLIWGADNDGDPVDGRFTDVVMQNQSGDYVKAVTGVTGLFFLDYPSWSDLGPTRKSYNWWIMDWAETSYGFDWGPQRHSSYRDLKTGRGGYPSGDPNRYYFMRNEEIDFDPIYTATISVSDPIWLYPPQEEAPDIAAGSYWIDQMFSIGPLDIPPGAEVLLPYAFVAGENFHTDPNNGRNLPYSPDLYYQNLDFSDLAKNALWAKWVYDNPGYDTDGDGDSGKTHICVTDSTFDGSHWVVTGADTFFYCGDGVPDWRAAAPPPPPEFWIIPINNGFKIRFNGYRSETAVDIFSKIKDFEGYRVYIGRDERKSSYSVVASYDNENYDKYEYDPAYYGGDFRTLTFPFTLDSLRCLYGNTCDDSSFNPLDYTRTNLYVHPDHPDSIFYFEPHDYNTCETARDTRIKKTYPDEPDPSLYPPDAIPTEAYTDDGYLKYYEYELVIDNLLPTVPYFVNVTAFDFGDARVDMVPLETSITVGAKSAYPLNSSGATAATGAKVYVWPNPYRIDAEYRDHGYEGRTEDDRPDYRLRELNFGNLPPKCTISIYSLDGDLIRRLDHDIDPADPNSSHDSWNLITRNTQMVVSGLYYWVVEAEDGSTQMGKFVVIM